MRIIPVLFLALLLAGCNNENTLLTRPQNDTTFPDEANLIASSDNQDIYEVPFSKMRSFLEAHAKHRIRSITSVDRGGEGFTSSFIVILEKQ